MLTTSSSSSSSTNYIQELNFVIKLIYDIRECNTVLFHLSIYTSIQHAAYVRMTLQLCMVHVHALKRIMHACTTAPIEYSRLYSIQCTTCTLFSYISYTSGCGWPLHSFLQSPPHNAHCTVALQSAHDRIHILFHKIIYFLRAFPTCALANLRIGAFAHLRIRGTQVTPRQSSQALKCRENKFHAMGMQRKMRSETRPNKNQLVRTQGTKWIAMLCIAEHWKNQINLIKCQLIALGTMSISIRLGFVCMQCEKGI